MTYREPTPRPPEREPPRARREVVRTPDDPALVERERREAIGAELRREAARRERALERFVASFDARFRAFGAFVLLLGDAALALGREQPTVARVAGALIGAGLAMVALGGGGATSIGAVPRWFWGIIGVAAILGARLAM